MLIVETPDTRLPERDYILGVVLGEFLGLPWTRQSGDREDVRVTAAMYPGELRLPDVLFRTSDEGWLTSASMPPRPLAQWDTQEFGNSIRVSHPTVPLIYGDREPTLRQDRESIRLPIDIFGSAFFMLSRYEELATPDRDEHDRFPAWASLAYQEGFLERPIIDEYVEVLWSAARSLWPGLRRKVRKFQTRVSHDVDRPSRYGFGSMRQFVRSVGGDILKRGDLSNALWAPIIRRATRANLHRQDPYNTFDWIMDQSERAGLQSAFYFICGRTDPKKDAQYEPEHPAIRRLMRRIHERGHEIGLHPSYNTYRNPEALAAEAQRLRGICSEERIEQKEWGGRMHYLRWGHPITLRAWAKAGMAYDSTLGYADHAGFRCGTCMEYQAFDELAREAVDLRIRPLIAMECSVMGPKYMALTKPEDALDKLFELQQACKLVRGCFEMLWHNSELDGRDKVFVYSNILHSSRAKI